MYGAGAAGGGRSRCVARRPHLRHITRPADVAPIWSRMPRRRCCAGPAPQRVVADLRELAAVDSGGSAKLAEAAAAYDLTSFVLASVVGADGPASCIDRRIACPGPAR
jgi:hypothetical protein